MRQLVEWNVSKPIVTLIPTGHRQQGRHTGAPRDFSGESITDVSFMPTSAAAAVSMMPTNPLSALDNERDQDLFESVTEEEIIYLWRSIKGRGLSEDEAWQAVVTGIALDMAFAKTRTCKQIEH